MSRVVGVINAGTKFMKFSFYSIPGFKVICSQTKQVPLYSPEEGWYEQDPVEMIYLLNDSIDMAIEELENKGFSKDDIAGITITNQRESTVVWDITTGKPICKSIVWKDIRTAHIVKEYIRKTRDKDAFKKKTGLPISPYFTAFKLRWLIDNNDDVKKAIENKTCKVGTFDSWLIWHLTDGEVHATDVTNASRTMLMNLYTLQWDTELLDFFNIEIDLLPTIHSCSEVLGTINHEECMLRGCKIVGVIGNQQATMLSQRCMNPGMMKCAYRSGAFLICNTGETPFISKHGLITTVAYRLGPNAPIVYGLEGGIAVAGHIFTWFVHNVRILPQFDMAEKVALAVPNTGGVYFVPALTGLYAPHWQATARGMLIGLTQFTTKHHIVRSAFEAICFQLNDIINAVKKDTGYTLKTLLVDGDLKYMNLLMQTQADLSGVEVKRFHENDPESLGAAFLVNYVDGLDLKRETIKKHIGELIYDDFETKISADERSIRNKKWDRAVERSLSWRQNESDPRVTLVEPKLIPEQGAVPAPLPVPVPVPIPAATVRAATQKIDKATQNEWPEDKQTQQPLCWCGCYDCD